MAGQRSTDFEDLIFAPGFYSNDTDEGPSAVQRWVRGDKVRFKNGLPEKIGGWQKPFPYAYRGVARNAMQWSSLDGERWCAVGTNQRLYLINNDLIYNITPVRRTVSPTNPFTTTNGSSIITVSDTAHGAEPGDIVNYVSASTFNGVLIDGDYEILTVPNANSYTIQDNQTANASGSGGGTPTITYEITSGLVSSGTQGGYGTGTYGTGLYGAPNSSGTFVVKNRIWSLQQWGEDLLASPNGRTIYWWDRTNGPNVKAVEITQAPDNIERIVVSPEDRFVLALGCNLLSGAVDRMFYRWCSQEDFTVWSAAVGNSAGSKRLDVGSRIVTGIKTYGGIAVWTDTAFYILRNIGSPDYWSSSELKATGISIMGPNSMIDINGTIYWMGTGNFYRYDGVVQVIPCDVWETVFRDINREQADKCFCGSIIDLGEIWWFYPSSTESEPGHYVVYNYLEKFWFTGTLARTCFIDRGVLYNKPLGFNNTFTYMHETGVNDESSAIVASIESHAIRIAGKSNIYMLVNGLLPSFKRFTGSMLVEILGKARPRSTEEITVAGQTVFPQTDYCGIRTRVGQGRLRFRSVNADDDWQMGVWKARAGAYGKR